MSESSENAPSPRVLMRPRIVMLRIALVFIGFVTLSAIVHPLSMVSVADEPLGFVVDYLIFFVSLFLIVGVLPAFIFRKRSSFWTELGDRWVWAVAILCGVLIYGWAQWT